MVVEADESDRSFLKLFPSMAVITNVDHEHLESYGGFSALQQAFVDFANRVPFYGSVVCCADDPNLAAILPQMTRRVATYGLDSAGADITAADVALGPMTVSAKVVQRARRGGDGELQPAVLGTVVLRVPGRHNLLNALATVTVGLELGLPFERIATGLREFAGAERRFEVRGEVDDILVVDDYGHHPTELSAVLDAARALNRRIVIGFQPHRYSRTAALLEAFGPALMGAAHIVLTDIYAAGEDPIPGITLETVAQSVRGSAGCPVDVVPRLADVADALVGIARPGDVIITLGAGSIGTVPEQLLRLLKARSRSSSGGGRP
jgi:UDP-N-acetylmuramate--alanine ligase